MKKLSQHQIYHVGGAGSGKIHIQPPEKQQESGIMTEFYAWSQFYTQHLKESWKVSSSSWSLFSLFHQRGALEQKLPVKFEELPS